MAQRMRARSWCFTINNDTFEDLCGLMEMEFKYMVFGFEIGENGTPHIQGYVSFENPRDRGGVAKLIPRGHLLIARGTAQQNYVYCTADGDFYEFGRFPQPGERVDLEEIKILLDEKKPSSVIADLYFTDYIRYFKGFERYRDIQDHEVKSVTYVEKANVNWNVEDCLYVSKENQLWSYDNETNLCIINQKAFDTHQLFMLEKGKPYLLGSKKICPTNVIIVK